MASPFVAANLYSLSGHGLQVTYASSGLDGKPHLHYQDHLHNRYLSGDQIRVVECDAGTLVSVTVELTVDAGSSTFSLLVPRVNLQHHHSGQVHTQGIHTMHRLSLLPAMNLGQIETYSVTPLHGSAQYVQF